MLHFSPAIQMEETKQAVEALVSMSTTSPKNRFTQKSTRRGDGKKIVFFCFHFPLFPTGQGNHNYLFSFCLYFR